MAKTTVEIADPVFNATRRLAEREGTTVRALIEEALRHLIAQRKSQSDFRMRIVTFGGDGLAPRLRDVPWERIRELSYEGRS